MSSNTPEQPPLHPKDHQDQPGAATTQDGGAAVGGPVVAKGGTQPSENPTSQQPSASGTESSNKFPGKTADGAVKKEIQEEEEESPADSNENAMEGSNNANQSSAKGSSKPKDGSTEDGKTVTEPSKKGQGEKRKASDDGSSLMENKKVKFKTSVEDEDEKSHPQLEHQNDSSNKTKMESSKNTNNSLDGDNKPTKAKEEEQPEEEQQPKSHGDDSKPPARLTTLNELMSNIEELDVLRDAMEAHLKAKQLTSAAIMLGILYPKCFEYSVSMPTWGAVLYARYGKTLTRFLAFSADPTIEATASISLSQQIGAGPAAATAALQAASRRWKQFQDNLQAMKTRLPPHIPVDNIDDDEDAVGAGAGATSEDDNTNLEVLIAIGAQVSEPGWPSLKTLARTAFREYVFQGQEMELSLLILEYLNHPSSSGQKSRPDVDAFIQKCLRVIPGLQGMLRVESSFSERNTQSSQVNFLHQGRPTNTNANRQQGYEAPGLRALEQQHNNTVSVAQRQLPHVMAQERGMPSPRVAAAAAATAAASAVNNDQGMGGLPIRQQRSSFRDSARHMQAPPPDVPVPGAQQPQKFHPSLHNVAAGDADFLHPPLPPLRGQQRQNSLPRDDTVVAPAGTGSALGPEEPILGAHIPNDGRCYILTTKMTWDLPHNSTLKQYMMDFLVQRQAQVQPNNPPSKSSSSSPSTSASTVQARSGQWTRPFFDQCKADRKILFCLQRAPDGKRPIVTLKNWKQHYFVQVKRNEANDVLKSPLKRVLEECQTLELQNPNQLQRQLLAQQQQQGGGGLGGSNHHLGPPSQLSSQGHPGDRGMAMMHGNQHQDANTGTAGSHEDSEAMQKGGEEGDEDSSEEQSSSGLQLLAAVAPNRGGSGGNRGGSGGAGGTGSSSSSSSHHHHQHVGQIMPI